jgi:putative ABC transport system permease protein
MNLENQINNWKKSLRKQSSFEDGFIAELESHLRDEIEALIHTGKSSEEAFEIASTHIGNLSNLNKQERLVNLNEQRSFMLPTGLLGNFIKVSRRQFRKNGMLNAINLAGLTVAFTALLFIGFFLNDELSFERHHPEAEKIYRMGYDFTGENGATENRAYTSGKWVDAIKNQLPIIEDQVRFHTISYGYIRNNELNRSFYEENIYWSDPNFFDFFQFDFKLGGPEAFASNINAIVLTEDMAKMHFGDQDPIGHLLQFMRQGNVINLSVTGIIKNPPSNSQFQPNYIAHLQAADAIYGDNNRGWATQNPNPGYVFSFVKITDESGVEIVNNTLKNYWNTVIPEQAKSITPTLTRLVDIHFNPPMKWEMDNPISKSYLYGLIVIGAFILIIAMTNFINLTTAQGIKRQKEIGLRKTLGSSKKQLQLQFFMESASLTVAAIFLAIALSYVFLPRFNELIGKNIDFETAMLSSQVLISLLGLTLISISLTGLFPALYFTRKIKDNFNLNEYFKPEKVSTSGRNAMVVLQFSVAIMLIIGTITVYSQLQLINNGKLGENREAVIGIRTSRMGTQLQAQRFINEIKTLSKVEASTLGMHLPRQSDFGRIDTKYFVPDINDEAHYWNKFNADGGFAKTYGLEFLAGVDFRENYDTTSYLLNEAAVRDLGISPTDALGLFIKEDSITYAFGGSNGVVIGVVKDFAYESVKEKIEPLVIAANTLQGGVLSVKLGNGLKLETIDKMEALWVEIYPGRPFEHWFLDKEFDRLYNQERRLGKLIPLFSGLAIIIALFGLFALTAYVAELRKKEIGIRKVLGCSSRGIIQMLSQQYLKLIAVAALIGIPIAWYGMDYWLNNFTFRVSVNVFVIISAVIFITVLSLITIGLKSIKAANTNPVESLKYE